MHAAARALVDQDFPNGRAAIEAAMKGSHRAPGAADRDRYRHPAETLELFGFTPTMTVLDIAPGVGWYTELLAPALAKRGVYLTTIADPSGIRGSNWGRRLAIASSPTSVRRPSSMARSACSTWLTTRRRSISTGPSTWS